MIIVLIVLACTAVLLAMIAAYWALLQSMCPESLRTSEVHTVLTHDLWKLRLCRYRKGRTEGEPVLLVHGFNANHHNFTSPEKGCLVDYLAERGYDCWAVDLRGCRSSEAPFERYFTDVMMDDYLRYDLPATIEYIRKTTGYNRVHWIGHSMGGALLYAYSQHFGTRHLASGVTLGAPIDFKGCPLWVPGLLVAFACRFPRLAGTILRGLVPFVFYLPIDLGLFPVNRRNLAKGMNSGHFITMLEAPPPQVTREMVFFLRNRVWRMLDDTLDVVAGFPGMSLPLLAVFGKRDPFISFEQGPDSIEKLSHPDKQVLLLSKENGCKHDYDHCDLAFGEEGRREVFAPIAKWLAEHPSQERIGLEELGKDTAGLTLPLDAQQRAGILSGDSYAHVDESILNDGERAVHEPILTLEAMDSAEIAPAPKKKTAPRKKTAAKTKKKSAAPIAKPKPKPKTAPKRKPKAKQTGAED